MAPGYSPPVQNHGCRCKKRSEDPEKRGGVGGSFPIKVALWRVAEGGRFLSGLLDPDVGHASV